MLKKTLAMLLCAALLCSLAGVGLAAETPDYLNLDTYYPFVKEEYKDQVSLDFAIIVSTDYSEKPEERYYWQLMEKVFNLKCNVTQVTNRDEYVTLTFTANDLPDIILGAGLTNSQLYNFGVVEGQLLDVAPYLSEELTPQLMKLFEQYPDVKAGITLPNGAIYAFPYIIARDNPETYAVSSINVDMLKELGYEEKPHTLEELTEMLYAFKSLGDDVLPICGSWKSNNPSGMILRAMGYEVGKQEDETGALISVRNGKAVLPGADAAFKPYLELMHKFYVDGIIHKDFFTNDNIVLQAQTAEKRVGFMASNIYGTNPNPEFYLQFESLPVLSSEYNSEAFAVSNCYYSFGGCVISAKTKYPELCIRWADWMMTSEGTNAAWVGACKNNETLMLEGWGGWYMNENYSRCDVDRENNPNAWTGAVEYLRQRVAGFNMGSLGYVAEEDAYRQTMSGLPLRLANDTLALDPNYAGFYYRTNAYEEYTPYLRTDISTMKFFFDEDTSDRIVELESVLKDYIENNIAKFVTGARSLDEFDTYLEEVKRQGAEEYVGYYAQAYGEYMANLAK